MSENLAYTRKKNICPVSVWQVGILMNVKKIHFSHLSGFDCTTVEYNKVVQRMMIVQRRCTEIYCCVEIHIFTVSFHFFFSCGISRTKKRRQIEISVI